MCFSHLRRRHVGKRTVACDCGRPTVSETRWFLGTLVTLSTISYGKRVDVGGGNIGDSLKGGSRRELSIRCELLWYVGRDNVWTLVLRADCIEPGVTRRAGNHPVEYVRNASFGEGRSVDAPTSYC